MKAKSSKQSTRLHMGDVVEMNSYGTDNEYLGYIEARDRTWVVFVRQDGSAEIYTKRASSGAVVEPPIVVKPRRKKAA
jgi:hypothetical protein